MNQTINQKRTSSIELLRIISIIMIVFHHFAYYGGFSFDNSKFTLNSLWYYFIYMGGKVGVNTFVLISGYFLILDNKILNLKKLIKLWLELLFYSVIIYLLSVLMGEKFSIKQLIFSCFPILRDEWWYATNYIGLFIIHPFLNIFLKAMDERTYKVFLVITVLVWSVFPSIFPSLIPINSLIWFVILYSISGYIRLHKVQLKSSEYYFKLFILCSLTTYILCIVSICLGRVWDVFNAHITDMYIMNRITMLAISLSIFLCFLNLRIENNSLINIIAATSFGVYLIHDNGYIRNLLWNNIFNTVSFQNSISFIPFSIGVCVLVFVICALIDLLRIYIFERNFYKLIIKKSNLLESLENDIIKRIEPKSVEKTTL